MPDGFSAQTHRVVSACEAEWDKHKSDCSGVLRAVAHEVGITLSGQANALIQHMRANWEPVATGAEAASSALGAFLVVGGLMAQPNGHVVVVVPGRLNRGRYPTDYWGRLGGVGRKNATINWSWTTTDRDRVEYFRKGLAK